MQTRLPLSLVAVLLFAAAASAALVHGPEREVAPSTTTLRFDGAGAVLASSGDGFLSLWHSYPARASFYRHLDERGQAIETAGTRLPVELFSAAAVWTGSEYIVAGFNVAGGIVATPLGGEPREIAESYYAADLRLAFNGGVLLLTWTSQTGGTQTLHGALLEPDLDVIRAPFVVTTREVSGVTLPLDHWNTPSIAAAGSGFLVTWELVPALTIVSATGDVTAGAAIPAGALQPTLAATDSGLVLLRHDRNVIHARRISDDGSPVTPPAELWRGERIAEFAASGADAGLAVAWRSAVRPGCEPTPICARRFDARARAHSARPRENARHHLTAAPPRRAELARRVRHHDPHDDVDDGSGKPRRQNRDQDEEEAHPGRAPAEPLGETAADAGENAIPARSIKGHGGQSFWPSRINCPS